MFSLKKINARRQSKMAFGNVVCKITMDVSISYHQTTLIQMPTSKQNIFFLGKRQACNDHDEKINKKSKKNVQKCTICTIHFLHKLFSRPHNGRRDTARGVCGGQCPWPPG